MKKSFMTRVLATGLSVAMAFSLSAATNVTTASAAVKKASTTTFMKVATKNVTEGKTTTTYMNSTATKKYRIKSHTESSVAKKYISVVMTSSRKGLKITAKDGAVTNAGLEKKGVNVKINFAAAKSVAAVKKAKATKYVNLKVAVKAAPVEKQAIVSAEATGVKTITLTMAKDVASVASPVAITVKKGTSTKEFTPTAEGKTITLAMDTKLIAGDYAVTIKGLEAEDLNATVTVAKDETLTTYEISNELAMRTSSATDQAVAYYWALNQYGEHMVADEPQVTSSFSAGTDTFIHRTATATVAGEIYVNNIPTVLAIKGTKGTIVLVDKTSGVNVNKEVVVSDCATATKATWVGAYDTTKSKIVDLTAGTQLGNIYLLVSLEDQYGREIAQTDIAANDINVTIAGGLTKLEALNTDLAAGSTAVIVDGKEYIAIKLKSGIAVAGDYTVTIVNSKKGMLLTDTYKVDDSVVVSSISVQADNGLYVGEENTMSYEITDTKGNSVTDYALLRNGLVRFDNETYGDMRWEKNADGSAKLVYDLTTRTPSFTNANSDTESTISTVTIFANEVTSTNYIVKSPQFTVKEARIVKDAYGFDAKEATSVAKGSTLTIDPKKFVYVDQYSNKVTSDDKFYPSSYMVSGSGIVAADSGCAVGIYDPDAVFTITSPASAQMGTLLATSEKIALKATKAGTATLYLKYYAVGEAGIADAKNYDAKIIVSATDTDKVDSTVLKIASIFDGNYEDVSVNSKSAIKASNIVVKGITAGSETVIPVSQYVIVKTDNASFTAEEIAKGTTTKKAKVTIQVTTHDSSNNNIETQLTGEWTISGDAAKAAKVDSAKATGQIGSVTSGAAVSGSDLAALFNFKDQYGKAVTTNLGDVTYKINVINDQGANSYTVMSDETNSASVVFYATGSYTVKVTATVNGTSKEYKETFTVSN